MNNINKQYEKIKKENRMGLMTHVVLGYPDLSTTRDAVLIMAEEGVDFIELQIPFSDPFGDGPTIHNANTKALSSGFHVKDAFDFVSSLHEKDAVQIPLLFMTYYNVIFHYGIEEFCKKAEEVGISGLIVPDYNFSAEAHDHFLEIAKKFNLILINFVAPDTSIKRMKKIDEDAEGFVYCFARHGVTGAQKNIEASLLSYLEKVKTNMSVPLAVGFGISEAEHILAIKGSADIAIVGSAILRSLEVGGVAGVREKVRSLMEVL